MFVIADEDYILQFAAPFTRLELLQAQSCPQEITDHVQQQKNWQSLPILVFFYDQILSNVQLAMHELQVTFSLDLTMKKN